MKALIETTGKLTVAVERLIPRILTQVCRDPNSLCHGAFDRDWWHYRTKDFSSIILQQGGYSVWLAGQLPGYREYDGAFRALAAATNRFWARQAVRHHAFEEYYPWECGYPPLAFSTLGAMRLLAAGVGDPGELEAGARIAARQLMTRLERQAGNQQVAGLAALAWLKRNYPGLVSDSKFEWVQKRTLELQATEGWFMEYGGPDTGYLSVTLDCLWDLYDATEDDAFLKAADRALDFMWTCVSICGGSPGMHNARNTDYILPYGIVRFMVNRPARRDVATALFLALYGNLERPLHFLQAIDDRYLCHYTGHSLIRACLLLRGLSGPALDYQQELDHVERRKEADFEDAGLHLRRAGEVSYAISLGKGGIVSALAGDAFAHDFGWIVKVGGRQFTNHWWSLSRWKWSPGGAYSWTVEGDLVQVGEDLSTPWKHGVLRVMSFVLGPSLIRFLKGRMIFREKPSPHRFRRQIDICGNELTLKDEIGGLPAGAEVIPAPRASKRHVASADSFHPQDAVRVRGFRMRRNETRDGDRFRAETVYSLEKPA